MPRADGKTEPHYPVSFALAHFIAARAVLSASRLLARTDLGIIADAMYRAGIQTFIANDSFTVYRDATDSLQQISSDELHCLAYIPTKYANRLPLQAIIARAELLATPFGFLCTPAHIAGQLSDDYHGDKVWVFEQAMIHYGAIKFGLTPIANVASFVKPYIGDGQELLGIRYDEAGDYFVPIPQGNPKQLWSVATRQYFEGKSLLTKGHWL